jgi:hypothetical protein
MAHLVRTFLALDPYEPSGLKSRPIGLERSQIDALLREDGTINDKVRLGRLVLAQEVTTDPIVVFKDWKRPGQEDGVCYCGRPKRDYRGPSVETPAPPNMVFCVFVKASGKMTAWRWEVQDPDAPDFPEDWKNRFGEILWPQARET